MMSDLTKDNNDTHASLYYVPFSTLWKKHTKKQFYTNAPTVTLLVQVSLDPPGINQWFEGVKIRIFTKFIDIIWLVIWVVYRFEPVHR